MRQSLEDYISSEMDSIFRMIMEESGHQRHTVVVTYTEFRKHHIIPKLEHLGYQCVISSGRLTSASIKITWE